MKQPTSGILYRGPSIIDGQPIVVVAVYRTTGANAKTGAMLQTYILTDNGQSPMDAVRSGADASICGDCIHRGDGANYATRSCYVNLGQGPTAVHGALSRGRYVMLDRDGIRAMGEGRMVRLGTYGDPAAVPVGVWDELLHDATGWTGYTHQWRKPIGEPLRGLCMASVDTLAESFEAKAMGWRTFRVREAVEAVVPGEFTCPASAEAGKVRTCVTCKACNGTTGRSGQASPVIIAHGSLASRLVSNRGRLVAT